MYVYRYVYINRRKKITITINTAINLAKILLAMFIKEHTNGYDVKYTQKQKTNKLPRYV